MKRLAAILILCLAAAGCARQGLQAAAPLPAPGGYAPAAIRAPALAPAVFTSQTEGLAAVVRELDAVAELVEIVSRLPHPPGEFTVSFGRIHADLAAMRFGLVEAIRRPAAGPRDPLSADYAE